MRGREPGFLNRPTVAARSSRNEQASTRKLRHNVHRVHVWAAVSHHWSNGTLLNPPLSLTMVPAQTLECIFWVNSPGEPQRSLLHWWKACLSFPRCSLQLSHEELGGESGSHYCPWPSCLWTGWGEDLCTTVTCHSLSEPQRTALSR